MYTIVPVVGKTAMPMHDYMFTDFSEFYKIAGILTFKLTGRWSIGIKTENIAAVKEFLKVEGTYSHLAITVYMSEKQVDFLAMYEQDIHTAEQTKPYAIFQNLCSSKNLLFAKNVGLLVYKSIEHDIDAMEHAVNLLYQKFGAYNMISEKMISSYFMINKAVYPRTVVLQYLWLSRWRASKLQACLNDFGNDVVLYAGIRNIKKLVEEKCTYFSTGNASKLIKTIDTKRLNLMYRVFVIERANFKDVSILFSLYERGLSCYDFVQERED